MPRFHIEETTNPYPYKIELERFWKENLPGTASGRLKWMMEGNPAGPATWFLAIDETKGMLAGTISVMPKMFVLNGQPINAGIIGDLMVDKQYRVFGPALLLPKAAVSSVRALGLEYLYTMPNRASAKILERCSFKCMTSYESLIRPINLSSYIGKYLNMSSGSSRVFFIVEKFITKSLNRLRADIHGIFNETDNIDESIEDLSDQFMRENPQMVMGKRSADYLKWRYMNNPQYDFEILTCRNATKRKISGYLVYGADSGMLEIFDIVSLGNDITGKLIKKTIRLAQASGFKGIKVTVNPRMPLAGILRRHLFINNKDKLDVYCPKDMSLPVKNWYFLAGDRNI